MMLYTTLCWILWLANRPEGGQSFLHSVPFRPVRTKPLPQQPQTAFSFAKQFSLKSVDLAFASPKNEGEEDGAAFQLNPYQKKLYGALMKLCDQNNAFYQTDFEKYGCHYRLFNYRMPSYEDFLADGAMECRGIMFEVHKDGNPKQLASFPMEKFFNLNENPLTRNLDLSEIVEAEVKEDGSLISTFLAGKQKQELCLKTRASLEANQSIAAMSWLQNQNRFLSQLTSIASADEGYTVNMEWCTPENQIVLPYEKASLIVLNIRAHASGKYIQLEELERHFAFDVDEIKKRWAQKLTVADWDTWQLEVKDMVGIEGYVLRFRNGNRVKLKTEWYFEKHKSRITVSNDRQLFDAVVDEVSDDLRTLFYDNPGVLLRIEKMESIVEPEYNSMVETTMELYDSNKALSIKDYMVKAQMELPQFCFPAAAALYRGFEVDFKKAMKKRWKEEIQEKVTLTPLPE